MVVHEDGVRDSDDAFLKRHGLEQAARTGVADDQRGACSDSQCAQSTHRSLDSIPIADSRSALAMANFAKGIQRKAGTVVCPPMLCISPAMVTQA